MCDRYVSPTAGDFERYWHVGAGTPWRGAEVFPRSHPLMRRMHKPDPKLGPDAQDKRSVVAIEFEDVDQWLHGTVDEARALVRLTPVEVFDAAPMA